VSWFRRPFLSNRCFFIAVRLLKTAREFEGSPDFVSHQDQNPLTANAAVNATFSRKHSDHGIMIPQNPTARNALQVFIESSIINGFD
jgi:hypothetical protein